MIKGANAYPAASEKRCEVAILDMFENAWNASGSPGEIQAKAEIVLPENLTQLFPPEKPPARHSGQLQSWKLCMGTICAYICT